MTHIGAKARLKAREMSARVADVMARARSPEDEASALVHLMASADDRRFWKGHRPEVDEVFEALRPVLDQLSALGEVALTVITPREPRPDTWLASLEATVLRNVLVDGDACDGWQAALDWFLRHSEGQSIVFQGALDEVMGHAGARSEEALWRFLRGHKGRLHAATVLRDVLKEADPSWACATAASMLRWLLDIEGSTSAADRLSVAVAAACGKEAAPLLQEVLDRVAKEDTPPSEYHHDIVEALWMLGIDPGPE